MNIKTKRILLCLIGILSIPVYDRFANIMTVEEYSNSCLAVTGMFLAASLLHILFWNSLTMPTLFTFFVLCNSLAFIYKIYLN